ncbi:RNA polymerase recycling motor HelD [Liquorilactobacillus oeni]|uniref:RNA polymerase recycling motor HelD n=1 Tax=Liquorilactobacillus oeni TaxID=303241 RepID=UPI00070B41C6
MDKELSFEQKRVTRIISQIKKFLQKTKKEYLKAQSERSSVEKNYLQNARINTFEVDDQMETNAEVQQQKQLVSKNIETEQILKRQVTVLNELKKSPYFGRIDIHEEGEAEKETLYIGNSTFTDENNNFLIYDWRAPISSIYYNGTLGKVTYSTPSGEQSVELLKKRQFNIKNGQIKNMFDTNETVGDSLLQEMLGQYSDEYMKNIVATIQQEQNDIIRDTHHDLLIVQGVAGSGKTSAILQRIAFLLYHNRTALNADQIVLFSPNRLFSHYISEVLPSLGERNMRQVTLAEFFSQRFEGLEIETLFERFEKEHTNNRYSQNYKQKETTAFMRSIKEYATKQTPDSLSFTDLMLAGEKVFSKEEITAIYEKLPAALPLFLRFSETKNILVKRLKKKVFEKRNADWVLEKVNHLNDEEYHELLGRYRRGKFEQIDNEEEYLGYQIALKKYRPLYDALYNDYFLDVYRQYSAFLQKISPAFATAFNTRLEYHKIALADCAPLLYLRDLLTGSGRNHSIQYLFIDEVQDYSPAQLFYLKFTFPNAKLTLLGDSEQALFRKMQSSKELMRSLKQTLSPKNPRLIELNKSYRSTKQITAFMKSLLPDGNKIQAFTRPGKLPRLIISSNKAAAFAELQRTVAQLLSKYETVAIIAQDLAECNEIQLNFRFKKPLNLISAKDRLLPKGLVLLPIYLAKGLEFDAVIVFNVSQKNYPDEAARGILYTICSRAMHELVLLSTGTPTNFIQNIPSELFSIEHRIKLH